jgi:hypothetical protein
MQVRDEDAPGMSLVTRLLRFDNVVKQIQESGVATDEALNQLREDAKELFTHGVSNCVDVLTKLVQNRA